MGGARLVRGLAAVLCAWALACGGPERAPLAPGSRGGDGTNVPHSGGMSDPSEGGAGEMGSEPSSGSATSTIEWTDPDDDVYDSEDELLRYPLDILRVTGDSAGRELLVTITFDRTLASHFAFPGVDGQRTGGAPAEIYLDLDDDPDTGEAPPWAAESEFAADLRGYEATLHVILGYDFIYSADGSPGSAGGDAIIDDAECDNLEGYADYWLFEEVSGALPDGSIVDTRDYVDIDGTQLELHVPYSWLGVGSSDTVRVMYREQDEGYASGIGYSNNKRLSLR